MKTTYLLDAVAPKYGWVYAADYFPRTFHYKREARERAKEVIAAGGKDVRIITISTQGRKVEFIK